MNEMPQQRRASGIPNFPQQTSQYNNQQFSPNSQRYMMGTGQVRSGQMSQPYGQQVSFRLVQMTMEITCFST